MFRYAVGEFEYVAWLRLFIGVVDGCGWGYFVGAV